MKISISIPLLFFSAFVLAQEKDSVPQLADVVVTGQRPQVSKNNVSFTVSAVERDILEKSQEAALLPVLSKTIPGLFVSRRGVAGFGVANGAAGQITIRGVGGQPTTGVLVLIDGSPQYMGIMGHPLADAYLASDAQRVEVIRGPASVLYGSNAMGGVINIVTRRPHREGFGANLSARYGTFNSQQYQGSAGWASDRFDAILSVNHDRTDGDRPLSAFRITNVFARAGLRLGKHFSLSAETSVASSWAEDPGKVSAAAISSQWTDILRGVVSVGLKNRFGCTDGEWRIFYNYGKHKIYDGFRSNDYNYGINLNQSARFFRGNTLTLGVDYKKFGGDAHNQQRNVDIVDQSIEETAIYFTAGQQFLKKITLDAGIRYETNSVFGSQWIPQGGLSYSPVKQTEIKISVSKGYRSPTLRELFSLNMGPIKPNEGLMPEQLISYQAGIDQYFLKNRLWLELTGYYIEGQNMIQAVFEDGQTMYRNTGKIENKGLEFSARYSIWKGLSLMTNYSFLDMRYPVLAAPENKFVAKIAYDSSCWGVSADLESVSGLYIQVGENPVKESYNLLCAGGYYRLLKWFTLHLNAENLTNVKYQINDGYPMPGFTLMGGISVKI